MKSSSRDGGDLLRLSGDGSGYRWSFKSDEEVRAGPEEHREPGTPISTTRLGATLSDSEQLDAGDPALASPYVRLMRTSVLGSPPSGSGNPVPARSPERPMPPDPEYGTSDYWERRYAERVDEQTFEWYGSFVALEDAIVAALPSTKALILHVGNGNSALPERLWACGYKWQHASDISPTVISRMAERTRGCEGLHWAVEDATCMPHAKETFDAIIDKGTYDALATGSYRERALVSEASVHADCD